ncbi:MAG: hypothetical protein KAJ23_12585 [Maribacter sp.]|nr:hypothetical protein [Maribacter sp.]
MEKIKKGFIPNNPKPNMLLLPLGGMGLFMALYLLAALTYPGGSWIVPGQNGFSFWNNYLCDLLDHNAINGELNSARHFARASLGVLCTSLLLLWYNLPHMFSSRSGNQTLMWFTGILSLITTLFLTSETHDITIHIAGAFGIIALITCIIELRKAGHNKLFLLGVLCLLVFLTNYYIYETEFFIESLSVIQKITFVLFISWFICLDVALYRKVMLPRKNVA